MLVQEIKAMPIEQRMLLMEQIWDSLCHEQQEINSPSWHQQILEERMRLIKSGKAKFVSIADLKAAHYEN
jgi:putative addiction module component (TIGR02574 family)